MKYNKKEICIRANKLTGQGMNKSAAFKTAWAEAKTPVTSNDLISKAKAFKEIQAQIETLQAQLDELNGSLSLQGYGAIGREFQSLMDMAYYKLNKNVVVIFHAKEEKDGDNTRLRILIEGQTKDTIWQSMDIGGFIEMEGNERVIQFQNCERFFAKRTYGKANMY